MNRLKVFGVLLLLSMAFGLLLKAGQTSEVHVEPDLATIDAYVSQQMHDLHIPGVALAIVQGNRIIHLQGFGFADASGRRADQ